MSNQRPRIGWIYKVNPTRTVVTCRRHHTYLYDHTVSPCTCQHPDCDMILNVSAVFRGYHPVIVWEDEHINSAVRTFLCFPLTSKKTFAGLYTSYPIRANEKNGLALNGYALVHSPLVVDSRAFRHHNDTQWLERTGVLSTSQRKAIKTRLAQYLDIDGGEFQTAWLEEHASPEKLAHLARTSLNINGIENLIELLMDDL